MFGEIGKIHILTEKDEQAETKTEVV